MNKYWYLYIYDSDIAKDDMDLTVFGFNNLSELEGFEAGIIYASEYGTIEIYGAYLFERKLEGAEWIVNER